MAAIDARPVRAPAESFQNRSRSATEAVHSALYRAFIGGAAMWQVVPLAVAVTGQTTAVVRSWVVAVAGLTVAAAVLALFRRCPPLVVAVGLDAQVVLLYAGIETKGNAAHLAAVWTCVLAMVLPAFVARARLAIPFTGITFVVVLALVAMVQPAWAPAGPLALAFATAWGAVAGGGAVRYLRRVTMNLDHDVDVTTERAGAALTAELAAIDAAEDARTMHDTVINTLAVIATARSVRQERAAIRDRCSKDVARISALTSLEPAMAGVTRLDEIPAALGLSVEIDGLPVADAQSLVEGLPERVAIALRGVVWEALLNADKHAHADHITMTFTRAGNTFEVAVADDGVGFDHEIHPVRGLGESVFARASEVGLGVDLSTSPGTGTVLRFPCTVVPGSAGANEDPALVEANRSLGATHQIQTIRRTVCWVWAVGMLSASAVTAVRNGQGEYTQDYPMLAAMVLLSFAAWWYTRGQRALPAALVALLIASVPAAFVASFASVDYGRGAVSNWQTLGVTAPMVVLLLTGRTLLPYLMSVLALATTVVITGLIALPKSADIAEVVPVGAAPALMLAAGFYIFQRATQDILERAVAVERVAFVARVRHSAGLEAARARERWRAAGLRDTSHLLAQIADGSLDPRDPEVQETCGLHEEYLRNVCMLSPRAIHLSSWLGQALFEARARSVRLTVRTSDVDVPEAEDARHLGALVLDAVGVSSAGSALTVGVFHLRTGGVLTLVGRSPRLSAAANEWTVPAGWELRRHYLGEEECIEVSWPLPSSQSK